MDEKGRIFIKKFLLLCKRLLSRQYDILILTMALIFFASFFEVESSFPADRGIYWQIIFCLI